MKAIFAAGGTAGHINPALAIADKLKSVFPEAEILHYLDIIDARMYDMEDALVATQPGEFSERVFTLENRQIYKPVAADKE